MCLFYVSIYIFLCECSIHQTLPISQFSLLPSPLHTHMQFNDAKSLEFLLPVFSHPLPARPAFSALTSTQPALPCFHPAFSALFCPAYFQSARPAPCIQMWSWALPSNVLIRDREWMLKFWGWLEVYSKMPILDCQGVRSLWENFCVFRWSFTNDLKLSQGSLHFFLAILSLPLPN